MRLQVIGTGSAGNAYRLAAGDSALLLDAGLPARRIIREMRGLTGLCGCLVTHEHGDHIAGARDLARLGVDVYATPGTLEAARLSEPRVRPVRMLEPLEIGAFTVLPFPTQHDARQPCGYLVQNRGSGETLLYATDTYYLRNTFPGVNYWLVECNYCDDVAKAQMEAGEIGKAMRNRLIGSHMSLKRLEDTLAANDLTDTRKIVLCHLSDARSDERRMVDAISALTGIDTVAASAGMEIDLNLTPF